jgi:SAM-dependent methyltransferase
MQLHWPAPERNKLPILAVLKRTLPERGVLLEIASGSGQHAAFFAENLPQWTWLPTDVDPRNLASIAAYVEQASRPTLAAPQRLDVCDDAWLEPSTAQLDAIFNANMIHISPWACCEGLLRGAGRRLRPGGQLILYGPFRIGGAHTAPSNEAFDADLRGRDPSWGVRDLETVMELAQGFGLQHRETITMPANNQIVLFVHA